MSHLILPAGYSDSAFYETQIANSCRFNDDDSASLSWTPSGAADSSKKVTIALWLKRGNLGMTIMDVIAAQAATHYDTLQYYEDQLRLYFDGATAGDLKTTAKYRDFGWYSICVQIDTTQATAADRVTIEVNGSQVTDFATETYPSLNYNLTGFLQNAKAQYVGRNPAGTSFTDGCLAQVIMLDGIIADSTSFGEFKSGIWIPKAYSGSYGTNGFHLDFADSGDLGNDVSGNSNDYTSANLTSTDQVLDTPTKQYAVMNPLDKGSSLTLSEGNQKCTSAGAWFNARSPFWITSGKHYFEVKIEACSGVAHMVLGVATQDAALNGVGSGDSEVWGYYNDGSKCNGSTTAYGDSWTSTSDIIGVAIDYDNHKIWFSKNGVWQNSGDPEAGTGYAFDTLPSVPISPYTSLYTTDALLFNFGQGGLTIASSQPDDNGEGNFEYTPPANFLALTNANLTEPSILESTNGFVVDQATESNIESTLTALRSGWTNYVDILKNLTNNEDWEVRFSDDSTNSIHFNSNAGKGAKATLSGSDTWAGISLRVGTSYGVYTDELAHTNGSDTDQAHSLGTGTFIAIGKRVDSTGDWYMSHPGLTTNYNIIINSTSGETVTQYVDVDATNVSIKSAAPTGTYRVLVIKVISQFTTGINYEGNSSPAGPFVPCTVAPALAIIKNADASANWVVWLLDAQPYNVMDVGLYLNTNNNLQNFGSSIGDLVCSGIKCRASDTSVNSSGHTHICIGIAQQPEKYANAR